MYSHHCWCVQLRLNSGAYVIAGLCGQVREGLSSGEDGAC